MQYIQKKFLQVLSWATVTSSWPVRPISSCLLSCCLLLVSFHLISPPTLSRRKHHSVPFTFVPLDRRWYRGYLFPRSFLLSSLSRFFTLTGWVATNVHARCPRIQRIALVFHYLRFTVLASNRYDDHGSNNQTRVGWSPHTFDIERLSSIFSFHRNVTRSLTEFRSRKCLQFVTSVRNIWFFL